MSADFIRERLFRPFDTTKGTKGMGIGVYQARDFMREAGGSLEVISDVGQGSIFRARLPLLPAASDAAEPAPEESQTIEGEHG